MVNEFAYAPTLTETARNNIRTACDALIAATGLTDTLISRVVKGDSAFIKRLPETSINIRTYDEVMGRLSAAWPEDAEWPASVPRPAPIPLPDATRADLEAAMIKRRAIRAQEEARDARRVAREARAVARHVAGRSPKATAGGDQAPAHP